MFCPFCGSTIPDDSEKCSVCNKEFGGKIIPQPVEVQPSVVVNIPEKPAENNFEAEPAKEKKNYTPLIIVAVIVATAIIVGALILAFGNRVKKNLPDQEAESTTLIQQESAVVLENNEPSLQQTTQPETKPLERLSSITVDGDYYKITMDGYLNMRTGPALDYDVVVRVPYGELVRFIKYNSNGKWAYVEYGPYVGWVSSPYIKYEGTYISEQETEKQLQTTETTVPYNSNGIVEFNSNFNEWLYLDQRVTMDGYLNVRTGPGLDYDVVSRVDYLTKVEVHYYHTKTNWAKISVGGTEGWVDADYLESYSTDVAAYYEVTATDGVDMYEDPGDFDSVLTTIEGGEKIGVVVINPINGMALAEYDGNTGWVDYAVLEFDKVK